MRVLLVLLDELITVTASMITALEQDNYLEAVTHLEAQRAMMLEDLPQLIAAVNNNIELGKLKEFYQLNAQLIRELEGRKDAIQHILKNLPLHYNKALAP